MTGARAVSVLLIEDDSRDAARIREDLERHEFHVEHADRLATGLERLAAGAVDIVLLDLSLPDGEGFEAFLSVRDAAGDFPIVVLADVDEQAALDAVSDGAADYVVKGTMRGERLAESIRYAIDRDRMHKELRDLVFVDELTGLQNRRGFLTLGRHQLELARRANRPVALLLVELDRLEKISRAYGQSEGDRAVAETARAIEASFRKSDLIARVRRDQFCALLTGKAGTPLEIRLDALRERLDRQAAEAGFEFPLSVTIGASTTREANAATIDELVDAADRSLAIEKAARGAS
jgi:diguanylate cyclase (GGDEF)-like protein